MSGRELRLGLTVLFAALFGICLGAGALGLAWATWPKPEAEISFATPQIVEVPYEVEVVRTVEVVVTPTPVEITPTPALPLQGEGEATPTPLSVSPLKGGEVCTDEAWIELQPKSDLQGDALKVGTINRLNFALVNLGDCTWDGYQLVSLGDAFAPIPIPYTAPGDTAIFSADDFIVRTPMELRLYIQTPVGEIVEFENGNPIDKSIYYRMDTWRPISQAQSYDGAQGGYGCTGAG